GYAAAWHDHVNMGMVGHGRSPCVQDRCNADARAEMLGIGGDRQHCLGCGLEQKVVDQRLVLERYVGDLGWQCEDDVEVSDGQEIGLPFGKPCACSGALALGAVPVAAGIVGDAPLSTILAGLDMSAQCRC